jgi:hypothetical protein
MGEWGQTRVRRDLAAAAAAMAEQPTRKGATALSAEEIYSGVEAGGAHDLGPWIETPSSTRVSRFRYDHLQRQLQVQWTNNKNHGYIYENVDYEGYRAFGRVASKGRHVNSTLNNYSYRPMMGEEELPSNEKRRGINSRVRT